jgi:hypothetical protein
MPSSPTNSIIWNVKFCVIFPYTCKNNSNFRVTMTGPKSKSSPTKHKFIKFSQWHVAIVYWSSRTIKYLFILWNKISPPSGKRICFLLLYEINYLCIQTNSFVWNTELSLYYFFILFYIKWIICIKKHWFLDSTPALKFRRAFHSELQNKLEIINHNIFHVFSSLKVVIIISMEDIEIHKVGTVNPCQKVKTSKNRTIKI